MSFLQKGIFISSVVSFSTEAHKQNSCLNDQAGFPGHDIAILD
jgi:hypothetical protein